MGMTSLHHQTLTSLTVSFALFVFSVHITPLTKNVTLPRLSGSQVRPRMCPRRSATQGSSTRGRKILMTWRGRSAATTWQRCGCVVLSFDERKRNGCEFHFKLQTNILPFLFLFHAFARLQSNLLCFFVLLSVDF